MKHFDCQKVLNYNLSKYAETKGLNIAYPNIQYEPKADETWLKLFYLPSISEDETFGKNRERVRGIMQLDIYSPRNTGTMESYKIQSELQDIFAKNSTVVSDDGVVRITDFDVTAMEEDDWFRLMCEIYYTSFN